MIHNNLNHNNTQILPKQECLNLTILKNPLNTSQENRKPKKDLHSYSKTKTKIIKTKINNNYNRTLNNTNNNNKNSQVL